MSLGLKVKELLDGQHNHNSYSPSSKKQPATWSELTEIE